MKLSYQEIQKIKGGKKKNFNQTAVKLESSSRQKMLRQRAKGSHHYNKKTWYVIWHWLPGYPILASLSLNVGSFKDPEDRTVHCKYKNHTTDIFLWSQKHSICLDPLLSLFKPPTEVLHSSSFHIIPPLFATSPSTIPFPSKVFLMFIPSQPSALPVPSSSSLPIMSCWSVSSAPSRLFSLDLVQEGALAVEQAARVAVSVEEEQHAQGAEDAGQQEEGQHHGHGPVLLLGLDDDHLLVHAVPLGVLALAAHPAAQHRLGEARLHPQVLVVELPVLVALVEVGVGWVPKEENVGWEFTIASLVNNLHKDY